MLTDAESLYKEGEKYLNNDDKKAFFYLLQAAQKGNYAAAQYRVACMYHSGQGVARSSFKASLWCQKAALQEHYEAQLFLTELQAFLRLLEKDFKEGVSFFQEGKKYLPSKTDVSFSSFQSAIFYFLKSAQEGGYAPSQFYMGYMYENGLGTECNIAIAIKWYKKASDQGHKKAEARHLKLCNYLSQLFNEGKDSLGKDNEKAFACFKQAALEGEYAPAQHQIGLMYSKGIGIECNKIEAFKSLQKAARQCNFEAIEGLANLLEELIREGAGYLDRDNKKALSHFLAVENVSNDATSQYYVGFINETGKVGAINLIDAIKWYQKSAKQGYLPAESRLKAIHNQLEQCVQEGKDLLGKDDKKAFACFEKAALEGRYAQAQYFIGMMYQTGQGVRKNFFEAIKWYKKSAHQGDAAAFYALGNIYLKGIGVPTRLKKAFILFTKAVSLEPTNAQYNYMLGDMFEHGKGVEQDFQKAAQYYEKAAECGHPEAQGHLNFLLEPKLSVETDIENLTERKFEAEIILDPVEEETVGSSTSNRNTYNPTSSFLFQAFESSYSAYVKFNNGINSTHRFLKEKIKEGDKPHANLNEQVIGLGANVAKMYLSPLVFFTNPLQLSSEEMKQALGITATILINGVLPRLKG